MHSRKAHEEPKSAEERPSSITQGGRAPKSAHDDFKSAQERAPKSGPTTAQRAAHVARKATSFEDMWPVLMCVQRALGGAQPVLRCVKSIQIVLSERREGPEACVELKYNKTHAFEVV